MFGFRIFVCRDGHYAIFGTCVRAHACVCVRALVRACVHMHVHVHVHLHAHVHVHVHVHVGVDALGFPCCLAFQDVPDVLYFHDGRSGFSRFARWVFRDYQHEGFVIFLILMLFGTLVLRFYIFS